MIEARILGENIRRYRKAANLTQSQLAEKVSVTTQAVSKWENGSIPDALLIFDIANALNVSIDALYGISDEMKSDPLESLAVKVSSLPENERMNNIINYALRLASAVSGFTSFGEAYSRFFNEIRKLYDNHRLLQIGADDGFTIGSFRKDSRYLFLISEAEDSYDNQIASCEEYTSFFKTLGEENAMKILLFLLHKNEESYILTSAIASFLSIPETECEKILWKLKDEKLVRSGKVENEEGEMYGWLISRNAHFLAVLIILQDLIRNKEFISYLRLTDDNYRFLKK